MTLKLLSTTDSRALSMSEEQIHILKRITEETNSLTLRNLQERYNQTVDLQLEQHRGALPDPIEYLPPEIWLQIFRDVVSGGKDDDESNPIDHLLLASLVSPKWRDAILNTPEIWTEVTVDPASTSWEDELFKLHAAMCFSGEGLLTLILRQSSYNQWEGENGVHRAISYHGRRIRKIVFKGAWNVSFPYHVVNNILLSLGPLPLLRVVHVTEGLLWTPLSWDDFLSNAPALVSINFALPLEVLGRDRIKSCREVSVSERFDEILPHLLKFWKLTSLSCSEGYRMPINPSIPRQRFDNFGDLEELKYYQMDIQPVLSILQVTFKLTTLSIGVRSSWSILTPLLQACHLLRSLSSLDIVLGDPANPNDTALAGPAGPIMVRSLITKYYPSVALPYNMSIASVYGHIANLVDILHLCTPVVQEFHFHAGLTDYVPFNYVSTRTHLLRLTLSLPELTSIPEDMLMRSTSLVCFNLQTSTILFSSFFRVLECPNLQRTVLTAGYNYHQSLASPPVAFDPAALPQLETIEWRNRPVFWQITSLQALQKLILTAWSREMISKLCLHFIMHPNDCPSLEYIEFGAIPEWDLLFIMLERRNHSIRSGVSRITTLVFPARIPCSVLAPMTELLNGRFAIGLSYHDIAISSIADFYFDTSITGCTSCLFSMKSCTQGLVHDGRLVNPWNRLQYPTPPAANPPISDAMSSWLDGREERERDWDAKYEEWCQQHTWRSSSCLDSILSKRMIVTKWNLKGVHLDATVANRAS